MSGTDRVNSLNLGLFGAMVNECSLKLHFIVFFTHFFVPFFILNEFFGVHCRSATV